MHTKGPWGIGFSHHHGIHCVDAFDASRGSVEICEVWGTANGTIEDKTSLANACLIAAAPDLLEALELAFEFRVPNHPEWERIARAAIAKAKGTTNA